MGGFADYYGQTNLHPLALSAVIALGLLALVLSRRHALLPLLAAATTMPMAQRLVVSGADFTLLRMLLLVYLLRVLMRGEGRGFQWNRLDKAVIYWTIAGTLIMTIHVGTSSAFLNRLGWAYDILLTYFVVRCMVRDWDTVLALAKGMAILSLPIAVVFAIEWTTQYNMFSVFGGVAEYTRIREDRLRCQGPFAHPILAGTFWAAALPLIWMQWHTGRIWAILGTAGALFVIAACASSTPIVSAFAAVLGVALFPLRQHRKVMWTGLFATLALLHFVIMKAPVWHLMARVDVLGGSTGWHRYIIFDTFVKNFSQWFLVGESNPLSWGVWHLRDITNQYMIEGLRGGLLTLLIFVVILAIGFGNVGRALTPRAEAPKSSRGSDLYVWLVGVALFVHAVTFFGVSYFGQMVTIFYVQLALIGCIGAYMAYPSVAAEPETVGARGARRLLPRVQPNAN
jgi:hypothetical protein